jgi:addiction module RelB/DinJ family antitoxin
MKTIINIKADKEVKEHAQRIAQELGLSLSAIINASLKQFIRSREVYFSSVPTMAPELEQIISRARKDYRDGKNISPVFSDPQKALDYLHK